MTGQTFNGGEGPPEVNERLRALEGVESALRVQIALAQNGDYAYLPRLNDKVAALLNTAVEADHPNSPQIVACIKSIVALREHLLMILNDRRQELTGLIAGLSKGKRVLNAYRNA